MNNTKIYDNNCKKDVLENIQLQKTETEYSIGKTLYAASNKGNRLNQEDSVIILEHPRNSQIKLIAVADGLGGRSDGDLASNHTIKKLIEWFEAEKDENIDNIIRNLRNTLSYILLDLEANINASTTLSAAIVLKNKTIIAHIGDSRIYTLKDNELKQQTRDDSDVQYLLELQEIPDKELTRFHKKSNILTTAIAIYPSHYQVKYKVIDNGYDKIIAVTDGVTDCLSTKQIENILISKKNINIAKEIVNKALATDSYLKDIIKEISPEQQKIIEKDYYKEIKGGQDNATAAIYVRKR